jgi:photosystem II stability/assembly factor-like uncharacterized protein
VAVDAVVHEQSLPPALSSVAFADATRGWAAGSGLILGTTDAGLSWKPEWTGSSWVSSLSAVDRAHIWGLAYDTPFALQSTAARLIRSADAGQTWSITSVGPGFRAIDFTTDTTGWAIVGGTTSTASAPGQLRQTTDAGQHWQASTLDARVDSVCFAGPSRGWAASGSGIFRTLNGGQSWARVSTGPNDVVNSGWQSTIRCLGSTVWVFWTGGGAGGSEGYRVARTLDGGAHWATVLSQLSDALDSLPTIDAYAGSFAVATSTSATFLGWCPACGFGTWSVTRTLDGGARFAHQPLTGLVGRALSDLTYSDPRHGWIAGAAAGGFLLASDDGGRTWRQAYPTRAPRPAVDVAFVSATLGFGVGVVGDDRAILRTRDGGSSWLPVGRLPAAPLVPDRDPILAFVDADHGWVAVADGLMATEDGGVTWRRVPGAAVGGVAFGDSLNGCTGSFGLPSASTTDGGLTWKPTDAPQGVIACAAALRDPAWAAPARHFDPGNLITFGAAVDSAHAWAFGLLRPGQGDQAGQFGIEATTNGGATWTAFRWPSFEDSNGSWLSVDGLMRLSFGSATQGWALTRLGRLFATSDGGATWSELP